MTLDSLTCVRVSRGAVTELTISRPKALNAINRQVLEDFETALTILQSDLSIRCLIVTGDGPKAFVAGADIADMSVMTAVQAEEFAGFGQRVFNQLENFPAPVLAAVNGFALGGGCELALACDIIYAAENAKFGQPEVKLGIMPGFGGTVRLPRKIGPGAASEWIFTGNIYSAQAAKEVGLVLQVLPAEALMAHVRQVAATIAQRAPLAVKAAKRVIVQDAGAAVGTALERWSFGQVFTSADTREGTRAFVDKREPTFKGE